MDCAIGGHMTKNGGYIDGSDRDLMTEERERERESNVKSFEM